MTQSITALIETRYTRHDWRLAHADISNVIVPNVRLWLIVASFWRDHRDGKETLYCSADYAPVIALGAAGSSTAALVQSPNQVAPIWTNPFCCSSRVRNMVKDPSIESADWAQIVSTKPPEPNPDFFNDAQTVPGAFVFSSLTEQTLNSFEWLDDENTQSISWSVFD